MLLFLTICPLSYAPAAPRFVQQIATSDGLKHICPKYHFIHNLFSIMAASLSYAAHPLDLRVDEYDWIGFDLDHALARYRVPNLMRLVHDSLVDALLLEQPQLASIPDARSLLLDCYDVSCIHKGVIVDFASGDVIKLNDDGSVATAWHGAQAVSAGELARRYGDGSQPWWGFDLLKRQARHESFFVLLTYFDMPCVCLASRMVQLIDDGLLTVPSITSSGAGSGGSSATPPSGLRYASVRSMLMSAFDFIFDNVKSFDTGRGGFFAALRADTGRYVCPRPQLREWLLQRRCSGKRVFLATNSQQRFADMLLSHALGPHWRLCFDLVIYNCLKPSFFAKVQKFYAVDYSTGMEGETVSSIELPALKRLPSSSSCEGDYCSPPSNVIAGTADTSSINVASNMGLDPHPPAVLLVQGHAGAVQALADAERWLKLHGNNGASAADKNADGCTGSHVMSDMNAYVGSRGLRLHLDSSGHVLRVTTKTSEGVGSDAPASSSSSAAPNASIAPVPLRLRFTKPAVTPEAAAWLAHGQGTPVPVQAATDGAQSDGTQSSLGKPPLAKPLPSNPHAPSADENEVVVPLTFAPSTATLSLTAAGASTTPSSGGSTPLPVAMEQASHDASEPPQALSLIDAFSKRRDPATGAELESGGAEARHPGHARILYVGDHLHGDVSAAVKECEWDAVAVVEELEVWAPHPQVTSAANGSITATAAAPASGSSSSSYAASAVGGASAVALAPFSPPAIPSTPGAVYRLPPQSWHAEPNWSDDYAQRCVFGNFFIGSHGKDAAAAAATAAAGDGRGPSPTLQRRSYFCSLLERHACLSVTDVETWLCATGVRSAIDSL